MRSISDIAKDIQSSWRPVNFAAKPWLVAMTQLDTIDDFYMYDSAKMILSKFLENSFNWRGDAATNLKKELIAIMKSGNKISEGEETEKVKEKQDKEKEQLKARQEKEQEAARKKDFEDGEREREQKKKEAERKKKLGIR